VSSPRRLKRQDIFFRPFGAGELLASTHGLRRGLHSFAAPRLEQRRCSIPDARQSCPSTRGHDLSRLSQRWHCCATQVPGVLRLWHA